MKTSALSAMQRSFKDPALEATSPYNYDKQFAVLVDGKEQSARLFTMLYTVLLYLRIGRPVKVFIAQGRMVFEHDGSNLIQADPVFVTVLTEFEALLLAERRDGAEAMRLAMERDAAEKAQEAARSQSLPRAESASSETSESSFNDEVQVSVGGPPEEATGRQGDGGRRDHRRRR